MKVGGGAKQNASLEQGVQVSKATQRAATTTSYIALRNSVEIGYLQTSILNKTNKEGVKWEGQTAAQKQDLDLERTA